MMGEELKNIAQQPLEETPDVATPADAVQSVDSVDPVNSAKPPRNRYPWYYVKRFDRYIVKYFLGTFFFAILLLFAIVVMFDINEKLDAVLTAPWGGHRCP